MSDIGNCLLNTTRISVIGEKFIKNEDNEIIGIKTQFEKLLKFHIQQFYVQNYTNCLPYISNRLMMDARVIFSNLSTLISFNLFGKNVEQSPNTLANAVLSFTEEKEAIPYFQEILNFFDEHNAVNLFGKQIPFA